MHAALKLTQGVGQLSGGLAQLRQVLPVGGVQGVGGESAEAGGVVPRPVEKAQQALQLLGGKGQHAQRRVAGQGVGVGLGAETPAQGPALGVAEFPQREAQPVRGGHRLLKGPGRRQIRGLAVPVQAALRRPGQPAQTDERRQGIDDQKNSAFFGHKKSPFGYLA